MRRLVVLAWLTAMIVFPAHAQAQSPTVVHGGGTGTFGRDLDGNGDVEASQFGMGVTILGNGSARGHFLCLMAGRSDIGPFPVMSVSGPTTAGFLAADSTVTFSGIATVNLGNGQIFRGIPFQVTVSRGGPGVGTLRLTVVGVFDGGPGDTTVGNGNYDLPTETVTSGQIAIG